MKRLEYKCSLDEQLLILNNFVIAGNTIYCGEEGTVDIIRISNIDAKAFSELYNQKYLEADVTDNKTYNRIKEEMLEFLTSRGYDINNKVEPIIHE